MTSDWPLQLARSAGIRGLQAALMCQVVHKNSLVGAIQQVHLCRPMSAVKP